MIKQSSPGLSIVATEDRASRLIWMLQDLGASAVETRDETTMTSAADGRVLLIAGFADPNVRNRALNVLQKEFGSLEVTSVDVSDDGWSAGWKAFFEPVVLETMHVITPWMDPPEPGLTTIVIDPGQAFGTGGHATTRMVLRMLESRAMEGRLPPEMADVGVGSGILAIAAVKLGAKRALGIDIDEESMIATRENAAANGVEGAVEVYLGTPRDIAGEWPLVVANIDLAAFQRHAGDIAAIVAPGGEVLLSGLLVDQLEECVGLWPGFERGGVLEDDGWAAVSLRRAE